MVELAVFVDPTCLAGPIRDHSSSVQLFVGAVCCFIRDARHMYKCTKCTTPLRCPGVSTQLVPCILQPVLEATSCDVIPLV